MNIARLIAAWLGVALIRFGNPAWAAALDKLNAQAKSQDATDAAEQATIAQAEAKQRVLAQTQIDLAGDAAVKQAAADALQRKLDETLTPKPEPALSADDELERLSSRSDG